MSLARGSKLGKYIIRDLIGEGGMGAVYRAREGVTGAEVAIKTILADKATDPQYLSRFRREATAIARIDNPHIVKLLDFVDGNPPFIVMEFLPGRDLGSAIRQGPLVITRAVDRVLEVCAAVGECHRLGFIHRDLKPTNIFLAEYHQIERSKVLDFGAAKLFGDAQAREGTDPELTSKGIVLGTPFYMAPELLHKQESTPKSDQYALGVVLYTALSGTKPFTYDRNAEFRDLELYKAIRKGDHPSLRIRRPDVSHALEAVVEKMMHVDPGQRYADLHAAGAALRDHASAAVGALWEAHFTSTPKWRSPQLSTAINAPSDTSHGRRVGSGPPSSTQIDSTMPPPAGGPVTSPTVPDGQATIQLGTEELRLASGDINLATTEVQYPTPGKKAAASVSVPVDDLASPTPGTARLVRGQSLLALGRRPAVIVTLAALTLGAALLLAFSLRRGRAPAAPPPIPPPEIFARPAPPAASATSTPAAAVAAPPGSVPPPAASLPAPVAAVAAPAASPAPKRPTHRRKKAWIVDDKGIPIPSD